jgi:squalene-hopene/tetraprenyl-beta-curcumene cyclase
MRLNCVLAALMFALLSVEIVVAGDEPQYAFGDIRVVGASAGEPIRQAFSLERAATYLDQGAKAWYAARKCVTCRTNGTYMLVRPALTAQLGPPDPQIRVDFVAALKDLTAMKRDEVLKSTRPAQVIYAAAGLAKWDAHVKRSLSADTDRALRYMLSIQLPTGTWGSADCWPPYESDAFHLATIAATAVADAPGWLKDLQDRPTHDAVEHLKHYLRTQRAPHDYGRVLLLSASTRMPDLLDAKRQRECVDMIWKHQRADGGWSIRTFAAPQEWGAGNRAAKLRAEPEFAQPPSDGHMTGMALVALREAGVPASDPRIRRGVTWLLKNQRTSGRWWTRSLNTDHQHFITYSGTALPLLALSLCDALPVAAAEKTKETR